MGIPVVPKDDDATAVAPGALVPMSDLDDYERPAKRGDQRGRSGPGL
jgi:hypothetical protein